jgi:hypothetical protein
LRVLSSYSLLLLNMSMNSLRLISRNVGNTKLAFLYHPLR